MLKYYPTVDRNLFAACRECTPSGPDVDRFLEMGELVDRMAYDLDISDNRHLLNVYEVSGRR